MTIIAKSSHHDVSWRSKLAQLMFGLLVVISSLLVIGITYQQWAMGRDYATYVLDDNLIDVNGVAMHIQCEGEGSPTIVFESGAGTAYLNWWQVQDAISQDTRTCVYDRQGLGWSEYTGDIPTPDIVTRTLHTLLEQAGESVPYVLVGHSMGGFYVREYSAMYPDEVIGMLLIDSVHQQQMARFPEEYAALSDSELPALTFCRRIAPFGILRFLNLGAQDSVYAENAPVYDENIAIFNQSHFCAGVSNDIAGINTLEQSVPASLGDMPLIVLTAGVPISDRADSLPIAFSPEILYQVDRTWFELQEELASLSTNSSWIVVDGATHFIHMDQPQVVIDAIHDILRQVTTD